MSVSAGAQQAIDSYLKTLRKRLRGIAEEDARDIVEEIRSHILDKTAGGDVVEAVLAKLGSPEDLATQYVTDQLLTRAQASRSPALMLYSFVRWAMISVAGFWILQLSLLGYGLGGSLLLCALLKPIHPATAGLWRIPDGDALSLRLGFGSAPTGGQELLGWWMVPLGLIFGFALIFITFRLGVWFIRTFRPRRTLPAHRFSRRTP